MPTTTPNKTLIDEAYIVVGRFNAPHGVRGQIKLESFTEKPENIFTYPLFIADGQTYLPITIKKKKAINPKQWIICLKNVVNRDDAAQLTNKSIFIPRDALETLDNDDYYWADLIGCTVSNNTGETLGRVTDLVETGANDVLIIKGDKEHWIPYTDDTIVNVNIDKNHITVLWDKEF